MAYSSSSSSKNESRVMTEERRARVGWGPALGREYIWDDGEVGGEVGFNCVVVVRTEGQRRGDLRRSD
jgi:hypothetical protein